MKRKILIIILIIVSNVIIFSKNKKPEEIERFRIIYIIKDLITQVNSWSIDITYPHITIETKIKDNKKVEETITDHGYSTVELQIIDEIYYYFKYKKKIKIYNRQKDKAEGYIILNIFSTKAYDSTINFRVDFTFYKQDQLIVRAVVDENSLGSTTYESKRLISFLLNIQ
ncbi:MAG: hypothetical protein KAT05_07015 [Spirochaetes bacterium]|nr:hypothetical protein [Spirochaetota bacterium]